MTSYERTRRAIEFDRPDRIAECHNVNEPDYSGDIVFFFCEMGRRFWAGEGGEDEWGCVWEKTEVDNIGMIRDNPIKEWEDLDTIRFPDASDPARYRNLPAALEKADGKYCVLANGSAMFERMHFLRGFEETLQDMYLNPNKIGELADRLAAFQIDTVRNIYQRFKGKIHAIRLSDDWGTQSGMIISPDTWRRIFKPRYKRIFDTIHECGMHAWLHSCGRINDILDDFIEIGLNVINPKQPNVLGIEEAGKRFAGRICFESLCDIQTTLPTGDIQKIREEAKSLLHHWATPDGGFVLNGLDPEPIGVTESTKQEMIRAFREFDRWKKSELET